MAKAGKDTQSTKGRKKAATQTPRQYSALEKCRAVLAVWTERRSVSEICKELGVSWTHLSNWQDKALAGMVKALETRRRDREQKPPALSERLQKLLAKKGLSREGRPLKADLQKRLSSLAEGQSTASEERETTRP
jgi:transposase-like protein